MIDAPAEPVMTRPVISATGARSWPTWLPDTLGVLACCAASLLALVPLTGPGMVATHDGLLHVQRLIALDAALRQGVLLPRWLPDLAYGYGEPVFLYYAPLAYLPALAARLLGGSYINSFAVASGLPLLLSGLAMYMLTRSMFGPLAAASAGIVYATLPYQLVDLYVRGALAESWAFVWLPLAAWCLVEARGDGRVRWSVGLALSLAGLIVTHNVTALLFSPALVILGLLLWLTPSDRPRPAWIYPGAGCVLGLGLSAWFWLPAIAEKGLVQLGEIVEPDLFSSFFLRTFPPFTLDLLYNYREPASTALGYPIFWPQVGLVQAGLSILGAVVAIKARGLTRAALLWATVLVVGGIALQVGPAARLYDLVPLLSFVQFPWRLLVVVGLGSSLLAGALVELADRRTTMRAGLAGLVVAVSLVTGLARLEPEYSLVDEHYLARDTSLRTELAAYGLGTTHSGEYLPATSGQRNAARFRKALLDEPVGRAPTTGTAPSSLQISRLGWRGGLIRVDVEASSPDRLIVHQFAFPGLTARVDGYPAVTSVVGPFGPLAVDVPVGTHIVEFVWGQTTLRGLALGISLVSLMALLLLTAWGNLRSLRARLIGAVLGALVIGVALVVGVGNAGVAAPADAETSTWKHVDDRLTLIGVQNDGSRLDRERLISTRLSWLVPEAPTAGYRAHLEVTGPGGATQASPWIYETDSRHWQRSELVQTDIVTRLPTSFPAGPADLTLRFDQPAGLDAVALGQIVVPVAIQGSMTPDLRAGSTVVPGLDVAATAVSPMTSWLGRLSGSAAARPSGAVDVGLRWRATAPTPDLAHEYLTVVALQAPGGDVTSEPARPGEWFNPLPFWQAGDVVDQRVRLALPSTIRPGTYPIVALIYARDLARGGFVAPGAAASRLRGRPVVEVPLGELKVEP